MSACLGIISIFKTPTSSAVYSIPVLKNFTFSPFLMQPLTTLQSTITPRKLLKMESKIKAWAGASGSPTGAGIRAITASKMHSTPSPVLPDARIISSRLQPRSSIISSSTSSGIALGMSILLITGIISKSCSIAIYKLDIVCACTPCVASTTSNAPSQAAIERETS